MSESTAPLAHSRLPTEEPLRVLVVDDEPTARRRIVRLLAEMHGVAIVGECASGRDALRDARALAPDIVFLDVSMPGLDGVTVARRLAGPGGPLVIFVTAHDQHALEAFRLHAADYVLKPLDRERLRAAVEHARITVRRARLERGAATEGVTPAARLTVRDGRGVHFVPIADILWVESYGNYVRVYTATGRHLHRATLAHLVELLAPHGFMRVHRTSIVNTARVVRLRPGGNGQYDACLDTGVRVRVSRTFRSALESINRPHVPGPGAAPPSHGSVAGSTDEGD